MAPKKKNNKKKKTVDINKSEVVVNKPDEKTNPKPAKTEEPLSEEQEHDLRLKEEAEIEAQEEMQVAFIKLMNGVQESYCVDDGNQAAVTGDVGQKLKWKWASGLDWNPSNPLMSNWMRVLAAGDYDGVMKEIENNSVDKVKDLLERRETLYQISALFHVLKGAMTTLNETGTQYVATSKFVDRKKTPKHFQCALKLIELGARVNARDMLGATPLFYCVMRHRNPVTMRIAKVLIDNGADVNAVNRLGETALIQPVMNKRLDCVKLLLKYGIDPTIRDNEGVSIEAMFKMDSDFKKVLEIDQTNENGIELCPLCDQPSRNRCTGCYVIRYCSKECQLAHWKKHKKICKETKNQYMAITLIRESEETKIPTDNFVVKVEITSADTQIDVEEVNSDGLNVQVKNLKLRDEKNGVLGVIGVSDVAYTPLIEKLKSEGIDGNKGYFQAVIDKEQIIRINVCKILPTQNW